MARFYKQSYSIRDGKPLQRKLIFIGQHELEVNSGNAFNNEEVEIEVEGENTAFILALNKREAKKIRFYLDRMGY